MSVLFLAALLCGAGLAFMYRLSSVFSAGRRAADAVGKLEALRSEIRAHEEEVRREVDQAARALESAVRAERLRNMSVDIIKKHAPGVRLQALKDAGRHSLLDLQGMDALRLSSIRGIGEKSAYSIAGAVQTLIREANSIPVSAPSSPFVVERDRALLQAIYRELLFDSGMPRQRKAFDLRCSDAHETLLNIQKDSTFLAWCLGFGSSARLMHARDAADKLTEELEHIEIVWLTRELSSFLAESRDRCAKYTYREVLLQAYREDSRLYDWLLAKALGHGNLGPRPVQCEPGLAGEPASASSAEVKEPSTMESVSSPPSHAKNATEAIQMLNRLQALRESQSAGGSGSVAKKDESSRADGEELTSFHVGDSQASASREFLLPVKPAAIPPRNLSWITPGQTVRVQGVDIARAYFYCGPTVSHSDYFVIDPLLPAKPGTAQNFADSGLSFSYAVLSPNVRFRYLRWLENGATEQNVPRGFPAIYFQGIERRALHLLKTSVTDFSAEIDQLVGEVRRVEQLYRLTENSISYHADLLLTFFAARSFAGMSMPMSLPACERGYELPFEFRLGLGWFIKEKRPIPADWAYRWAYLEPTIYPRTAVTRCPNEFEMAFLYLYAQKYGDGLVIKPNKTLLSITYQPIRTGGDDSPVRMEFDGIPDVKALTAPQQALKEFVEHVTEWIDPYSRFLGPAATKAGKLEALLMLPGPAWPEEARVRFGRFRAVSVEQIPAMTCEALFAALECQDEVTSSRVTEMARGLQRFQVGFEPDVLSGARRPKASDPVVLFPLSEEADADRKAASYQTASLSVALASVLSLADGHASDEEAAAADGMIGGWEGIGPDLRSRLRAYYRLCLKQPPTLASLKVRLEALNLDERKRLASSLSSLAASDGFVSPEEVKLLERIYKILTLETQGLYSDLHGAAGRSRSNAPVAASTGKAFLDRSRITELRRESSQVSQLLAEVFLDEGLELPAPASSMEYPVQPIVAHPEVSEAMLPGLTGADQRFLVLLVSKTEWPREELLRAAEAMQIMLDGALERINEAALDRLGDLLVDGHDPVYVEQTLLEIAE